MINLIKQSATFSPCRKYRYTLWRNWDGLFASGFAMFIGLNPSTADETNDDPTIRRCIGYAKDWGYAALCMTNLFAFRATTPDDMKAVQDPIGSINNCVLKNTAKSASIVIAAWGVHGAYLMRDEKVRKMIPQLHYLKLTKDGFPAHSLYLPKGLKPILWEKGISLESPAETHTGSNGVSIGMALTTLNTTLIIHAIGAPIYFRRFNHTSPLTTAAIFIAFVIAVDFFLVALIINKSLDMFRSFLGTWLPFILIFSATWVTGKVAVKHPPSA